MNKITLFLCFILLFGGCAGYVHKYNVGDKVGIIRKPTGFRGDGTRYLDIYPDTKHPVGIIKRPSTTGLHYFIIVNGHENPVLVHEEDMFLVESMDWRPVSIKQQKIEEE